MALHRKFDALLELAPDVAIISETAEPARLRERSARDWIEGDAVWVGDNPSKGLGVFTFNGYGATILPSASARLRYVVPISIVGPVAFNLLAVWAQLGATRKHQPGPLRLALTRYREFLAEGPSVVAGDFNSNAIWDKPGWRRNQSHEQGRRARRLRADQRLSRDLR